MFSQSTEVRVEKDPLKTYKDEAVIFLKRSELRDPSFGRLDVNSAFGIHSVINALYKEIKGEFGWELRLSSRVAYMNALKQLVQYSFTPKDHHDSEFLSRMLEQMTSFIKKGQEVIEDEEKGNLLSKKESKRWMDWNSIVSIYESLVIRVEVERFGDKNNLYELFQQRLLLAMYMYHPPLRLDFGCVYRFAPVPVEGEEIFRASTHIVINSDGTHTFFLVRDKVSHKIGTMVFDLHPAIVAYCNEMDELFGFRRYLITFDQANLTTPYLFPDAPRKDRFRSLLGRIPNEKGYNSNLCVDTIRSAYITDFLSGMPSLREKERIAKAMRTSTAMMDRSYFKINGGRIIEDE